MTAGSGDIFEDPQFAAEAASLNPALSETLDVQLVGMKQPVVMKIGDLINIAAGVATDRYDLDTFDAFDPSQRGPSKAAHQLFLLLTLRVGIPEDVLLEGLPNYESVDEIERAQKRAEKKIKTDDSFSNRYDIAKGWFKRKVVAALTPTTEPATKASPPTATETLQSEAEEKLEDLRLALTNDEADLVRRYQAGDSTAATALDSMFEHLIHSIIDHVGPEGEFTATEEAWQEHEHVLSSINVNNTDPKSPLNLVKLLEERIITRIARKYDAYRSLALTINLDVTRFAEDIAEADRLIESDLEQIPNSPKLEHIISRGRTAINRRTEGYDPDYLLPPIHDWHKIPHDRRKEAKEAIKNRLDEVIARRLKVSQILAQKGSLKVHIGELLGVPLVRYLSILVDEIAAEQIEQFKSA